MKPLKLTISDFGSYAGVQTIDFTLMGEQGLYLITGETGAGKTTIFDAISFVLFGEASGEGRKDYKMLCSHFAGNQPKTFVELDFLSNDKIYNIRRDIKNGKQSPQLTLPPSNEPNDTNDTDKTKINLVKVKVKDVAEKIGEIVGLTHEQFRQIVMIAQNDFLRFLRSNTDDRLKILRHIFGTEVYRSFQEKLNEMALNEQKKYEMVVTRFRQYEINIDEREIHFSKWVQEIKSNKTTLDQIEKEIYENAENSKVLAVLLAEAEELNKKFINLDKAKTNLATHLTKAEEMAQLAQKLTHGEIALRKVKPYFEATKTAQKEYENSQKTLKEAKKLKISTQQNKDSAIIIFNTLPSIEELQANFAEILKKWEITSQQQNQLEVLHQEYAQVQEIEGNYNSAQQDLNKAKEFDFNNERRVIKLREELEQLIQKHTEYDSLYRQTEEFFLLNQAGIIAKELKDGNPCPVCGSKSHPTKAEISDKNISEAILKKHKKNRDDIENERNKKLEELNNHKADLQARQEKYITEKTKQVSAMEGMLITRKENVVANLITFIPNIVWENASDELIKLREQTNDDFKNLNAKKLATDKELKQLQKKHENAIDKKNKTEIDYQSAKTLVLERENLAQSNKSKFENNQELYHKALKENNFLTEKEFLSTLISEEDVENWRKLLQNYEKSEENIKTTITHLEMELTNKKHPDVTILKEQATNNRQESTLLNQQRDSLREKEQKVTTQLNDLRQAEKEFLVIEKSYATIKDLSDVANGKISEIGKLDFETYVQTAYFERVLYAANLRLSPMSKGQYILKRKVDTGDRRSKMGMDIEVLDTHTGKLRLAHSLSGGESFMASLSLALALSDVVQQTAGGIHLDTLFIDEGFGSLDSETLDIAITTLAGMAGENRTIGIISHVTELNSRIDKQIRVQKTREGSKIKIIS